MKHARISAAIAILMFGSSWWTAAQQAPAGTAAQPRTPARRGTARRTTKPPQPDVSAELNEMKALVQQDHQEIQALKDQLAARDQALQAAQQQAQQAASAATQASSKADQAASQASDAQQNLASIKTDVADVKFNATTTALSLQDEQKRVNDMVESPIALHYKGITLTPGGFLAAETVWRSRGIAADVNTPFNSVPFPAAGASRVSEFFGSGRQSRISLLGEGKLGNAKLTGYFETDWLSAGVTSNNNQSNSYTNRQRQIWGQAAFNNGWSFTGGQMWSLVTETKKGLDNRTEALPSTIDAQYHVGFSWARQFGARFVKNFNNKAWLGFAIEDPQTLLTAHGNAANLFLGAAGTGGGLYNLNSNYSFNATPDFIVKAAFEPGWGHYEMFGILRDFRDRIYPNATATPASSTGAFNKNTVGGGFGANARGSLANKHIDIGLHFLAGDGVGRYGTSTLADTTVRPDGSLSLIHAYQGLGTLEWHSKHWDWYANAGAEYAAKTWYLNAAGKPVGYGAPGFNNAGCFTEQLPSGGNGFSPGGVPSTCTADTKSVFEGTVGFYYKFYNGPKGRVQWGPQYSYVVRTPWSGVGGRPLGIDHMIFTGFRYYLP